MCVCVCLCLCLRVCACAYVCLCVVWRETYRQTTRRDRQRQADIQKDKKGVAQTDRQRACVCTYTSASPSVSNLCPPVCAGNPASGRQWPRGDVGRYVTDSAHSPQRHRLPASRPVLDSAESPGLHGQVGRQGVHLLQGEQLHQFLYSSSVIRARNTSRQAGLSFLVSSSEVKPSLLHGEHGKMKQ